jgi:hypothetical protein
VETCRTIAEAFHRTLEYGLLDRAEVIAWVDRVIAAEPRPAFAFIAASSCGGDLAALLAALREVPGAADPSARRRLIFGLMRRAFERDRAAMSPIVCALLAMAWDGDVPDRDGARCMRSFADELADAEQGFHGRVDDVRRGLVEFLCRHGERLDRAP